MRGSTNKSLEITQNSILRISDKKTLQLIREYKKEECLWNSNLHDYPNREKRIAAADKIAGILNIPNFDGKHVMIKFKNLRNSYSQEMKKIAQSVTALEAGIVTELYRPKVQWFSLIDSFIRPHLQTSRPVVAQIQPDDIVPDVKIEFYETDGQADWSIPLRDRPETSSAFSERSQSDSGELSNDSRTKKRRLSTCTNEPSNQDVLVIPGDFPSVESRLEDTYDNFGKYIASLLRNLPPEKALKLQPMIVNMIVDVGFNRSNISRQVDVKVERLNDTDSD